MRVLILIMLTMSFLAVRGVGQAWRATVMCVLQVSGVLQDE